MIAPFFFDSFELDRDLRLYPLKTGVGVHATGGRDGGPALHFNFGGPFADVPVALWVSPAPARLITGFDLKPHLWAIPLFRARERGFVHYTISFNSSDYLIKVFDADGVLRATAPVGLVGAAYQFMDIIGVIHPTAGSVEIIVEGERWLKVSNIKTRNSAAGLAGIHESIRLGSEFFDTDTDQAFLDNLYLVNGDLPGAVPFGRGVATLQALTGDVSVAWSRSAGAVNSALLDEIPPSMTDYIFPPTPGVRDRYSIAPLFDVKAIPVAVRLSGFAQKTDGLTRKYRVALRDGAEDAFGPDVVVGGSIAPTQTVFGARPNGGTWYDGTQDVVNDLTVGPEDRT